MKMSKIYDTIKEAKKHNVPVITTVEAFHKEPRLLYDFLRQAANHKVEVRMIPIVTTDQSPPYKYKDKPVVVEQIHYVKEL